MYKEILNHLLETNQFEVLFKDLDITTAVQSKSYRTLCRIKKLFLMILYQTNCALRK